MPARGYAARRSARPNTADAPKWTFVLGVALGFGAQALVKDYLAGIFVVLEDQYGIGDTVDVGPVTGVVEDVSLRITRIRDEAGVIWYVRNGEIVRVANQSQGKTHA